MDDCTFVKTSTWLCRCIQVIKSSAYTDVKKYSLCEIFVINFTRPQNYIFLIVTLAQSYTIVRIILKLENNVIYEGWELYCQSDELLTISNIWLKFEYLYRMLNNMFPLLYEVEVWRQEKVNEIFDVDFYIATQVFQSFQSSLVLLLLTCFYRLSNDSRLIQKNKQTSISEARNFIIKKMNWLLDGRFHKKWK